MHSSLKNRLTGGRGELTGTAARVLPFGFTILEINWINRPPHAQRGQANRRNFWFLLAWTPAACVGRRASRTDYCTACWVFWVLRVGRVLSKVPIADALHFREPATGEHPARRERRTVLCGEWCAWRRHEYHVHALACALARLRRHSSLLPASASNDEHSFAISAFAPSS